jgi:hypothetical protein
MVFGRYLSRICLSLSIAIAFGKPVGHVRSHPRKSIATAGTEAMDSGVAATRKSDGVTHISPPLAFAGSAAQWYRWPYDPRPAQVRNPPGLTSCETPGAAQ